MLTADAYVLAAGIQSRDLAASADIYLPLYPLKGYSLSAPIIGATRYPNLWLNVGQGPLGFTFACGSAKLLADCVSGRAPPFSMDGLTLR
jgi:glycine/D-amino acid oxidase-like deaminating enzyme